MVCRASQVMIRDMKRERDEDNSRFSGNVVMGNRYMLLQLLGKGGFSEVFKVCGAL